MKFILKTTSNLIMGNGQSKALIDQEIQLDEYGLPYIGGRRFKGLLKESAQEVLEITSSTNTALLDSLFGNKGTITALLESRNLYLVDESSKKIAESIHELNAVASEFDTYYWRPELVTQRFCTLVSQTAIEKEGIAKKGSLRFSRAVISDVTFDSENLDESILTEQQKALIYLAALNLRRGGKSRNKGKGAFILSFSYSNILPIERCIELIKLPYETSPTKVFEKTPVAVSQNSATTILNYVIELSDPVIIANPVGEQNTVYTMDYIPGNIILGVLAERFINKYGITDEENYRLFLSLFQNDNVIFNNATISENDQYSTILPMLYQQNKGDKTYTYYNSLNENNKSKSLKYKRQFFSENTSFSVKKQSNLHIDRTNRIAGTSKKDEGAIFYYESMNAGQLFNGSISGNEQQINILRHLFSNNLVSGKIGRSQNNQYGKVKITIKENSNNPKVNSISNAFYIVCESQMILLNENGYSSCDPELLTAELSNELGVHVTLENAIQRQDKHANFVGIWHCKSPEYSSIKEGSVFKYQLPAGFDLNGEKISELQTKGFGELRNQGFGKISIFSVDSKTTADIQIVDYRPELARDSKKMQKIISSNEKLKDIVENALQLQLNSIIKERAQSDANKFKIKNAQAGVLIDWIKSADTFEDWNNNLIALLFNNNKDKTKKQTYINLQETKPNILERIFNEDAKEIIKYPPDFIKEKDTNYTVVINAGKKFIENYAGIKDEEIFAVYWSTFLNQIKANNKNKK